MNYETALEVRISDKLTKAQLIEVSNTLQDHCLIKELDEPRAFELISKGISQLYKQFKYEFPLLIKDIKSAGAYVKNSLQFVRKF